MLTPALTDPAHLVGFDFRELGNRVGHDAKARVVDYIKALLPPVDTDIRAGATLTLAGFITLMDGVYQNTALTTDYSIKQIGAGIPQGQVIPYTIRAGDTLQSIASAYYGSPSYWYLIAHANGLTGNEPLTEGTTLTIPNRVANSINNASTYSIYNDNDIIGSTNPEIVTIPKPKKKKKWYQKLLQVLIIVIIIVAAVFTAGAALGALGLAATGFGVGFGVAAAAAATTIGLTGVIGGLVVAVALGAAIGAATSIVTQGLAIMGDLQEKFDWKGVRNMAKSFAVTALTAAAGGWVANNLTGVTKAVAQGAVTAGGQYLENGKITNVSGILLAMVPGAAAGSQTSLWGKTVSFVNENKKTVGAGLAILEKRVRGEDLNALDWANVATAVLQGPSGAGQYLNSQGDIKWGTVATQALVSGAASLYVRNKMGEETQLSFLGSQFGDITSGVIKEQDLYTTFQEKILRLSRLVLRVSPSRSKGTSNV